MAKRARTFVSSKAGTTRGFQLVKAGSLQIVDSPGVIPFYEKETKMGMIAAKDPEKMKNPDILAINIVETFIDKNLKALENFYGVKLEGIKDPYDMVLAIGKRRGFLRKGGVVDENRTVTQIIRDWQKGKLGLK